MIGHFLAILTPEEEDRVLTGRMRPGAYNAGIHVGPCLVGTALGCTAHWDHRTLNYWWRVGREVESVENRYDSLCRRFGNERINAAIRNRVLANRMWRTLKREPWPAGEVVE